MIRKIFISLFVLVLLIGIVFSAGEIPAPTTSSDIVEVGNTEKPIGDLIGEGLGSSDVVVKGVDFIKKGNENTIISFLKGGSIIIKGIKFENITEDSSIELDNSGKITFANLTASKDTSFNFKDIGGTFNLSKGQGVIYNNGKMTFKKGEGKDSFGFRQDVFDESGKNIGKFVSIKMNGESVNIEKDTAGNSIFTGNFDIGENKVEGRATLSKEGKISEVWKGTYATINNVDFNISGNNLKMYYDENFNPVDHKGENYFNYKKDKISLGGDGFTSDLTKSTNIFGDMKNIKVVTGIGTKTRDLEINMNGGSLEISKDLTNKNDLGFNVKSDGSFIINNGRDLISSDGTDILVKTNEDKDGLLYSYNLNFNEGQYKLEDNIFTNKEGSVLVNLNTYQENVAYKRQNFYYADKERIAEIEKQTGDGTFLNYSFALKDEWLDQEILGASKNLGISGTELAGTLAGEGWFSGANSVWNNYKENPNQEFLAGQLSLTKIPGFFEELQKRGLVSSDSSLIQDGLFTKIKGEDAFNFVAATVKYCDLLVKEDIGETEYNSMTDDEKFFWTTYYYNTLGSSSKYPSISIAGRRALTQKREETYVPTNAKEYITNYQNTADYSNPQINANIREAIYMDFKSYFDYP